jgi:signal transduction histidine kinase
MHTVTGDHHRLIQVVINLLSNAVKFTAAGSVTVRVAASGADEVVVSVADTGAGIAPDDQARVFEAFAQAGDTLTDKPRGTGLGLPISREIVEEHGGRLWLESEVGRGSTFAFALPVTAGATADADGVAAKAEGVAAGAAAAAAAAGASASAEARG